MGIYCKKYGQPARQTDTGKYAGKQTDKRHVRVSVFLKEEFCCKSCF